MYWIKEAVLPLSPFDIPFRPLSSLLFFFSPPNFFPCLWNDVLFLHIDNDIFQERFGLDQRFIETAKKLKSQHKIGCLSW